MAKANRKATQRLPPFQYAVKFICTSNLPGTSQTTPSLLPGSYQTVVNIHNPSYRAVRYRMKLVRPGPGGISSFVVRGLAPDGADRVTCSDIRRFGVRTIHGFEGFLVIQSQASLDIVAVYTAAPLGSSVSSIDVEYVPERRLG